LRNFGAKIIVCLAQDVVSAPIIYAAANASLFGPEYVWIISEALYNYVVDSSEEYYDATLGYLNGGFILNFGFQENPLHQRLLQRWLAMNYSLDVLDVYALATYDAVLAMGHVLQLAISAGVDIHTGANLLPLFAQVHAQGVSGEIGFNDDLDPLVPSYSVLNVQLPDDADGNLTLWQTVQVGLVQLNRTAQINGSLIRWNNAANVRPSDVWPSSHGLPSWAWGVIALGIVLVAVGIVGIIALVVLKKNHVLFVPRSKNNDEWGA